MNYSEGLSYPTVRTVTVIQIGNILLASQSDVKDFEKHRMTTQVVIHWMYTFNTGTDI